VGILGANHSGKSSIIDIILFCLYDRCSRGDRREVVNCNKTKFHCHLVLQIGNVVYHIDRSGTRSKAGSMRVVVEFYKHDVNVEMTDRSKFVSLNGVDRYDTNRKIAELIGTYDDLTVTSISLQNKSNAFIEMP